MNTCCRTEGERGGKRSLFACLLWGLFQAFGDAQGKNQSHFSRIIENTDYNHLECWFSLSSAYIIRKIKKT